MLLLNLLEQHYEMTPEQQERWAKVVNIHHQPQPAPAQQKQNRGKEYRMKFKDEEGGGEYKIKVRKTKDNEVKWNYGHYNMTDKPDISNIDLQKLTPKGHRVYQQMAAVLNQEKKNEQPAS